MSPGVIGGPPYPPESGSQPSTNEKTYSSSSAIQKNGSVPMNVEPRLTTESNWPPRFQAANAPSTMPTMNAMTWVTPTSTSVHGSFCRMRWPTGVGKLE